MKTYTMLVVFDRCKDLEQQDCSLAALKNVGIQAVVTEFLISHADILFTDSFMNRRREHTAGRFCSIIVAVFVYVLLLFLLSHGLFLMSAD